MTDNSGSQTSATFASERYSTSIAPDGLRLTQELANTIAHARPPVESDLIGGLDTAQVWLDRQVDQWCSDHQVANPDIHLTATGLRHLRQLRDTLRNLLDGGSATDAPLTVSVNVSIAPRSGDLAPTGNGIAWLRSAIATEWLLASIGGDLRRMKLCRNHSCDVAFYDQSKNNSRAWHNVAKCGNIANVRAYRQRQRADHPTPGLAE